jgi:hypothetical protein
MAERQRQLIVETRKASREECPDVSSGKKTEVEAERAPGRDETQDMHPRAYLNLRTVARQQSGTHKDSVWTPDATGGCAWVKKLGSNAKLLFLWPAPATQVTIAARNA